MSGSCLSKGHHKAYILHSWAFSSFQPSSQSSGHRLYQPSSTAKQLNGYTWSIRYGDGSQAAGVVYTDAVTIGGGKSSLYCWQFSMYEISCIDAYSFIVTYASQAVEADTSVSSQLVSNRADGFVGLAFNNDNQVKPIQQKTFLSGISPSLQSPTMVANLKYHGPGTYDFGYINSSRYTGSITYTNVNPSSGFWQIAVSGYGSSPFNAIVDTGSSLIYLPSAILSAYYSKVSGAQNSNVYGGWVVPCGATLSNLSLRIGTFNAVVPGKYIVYGPVGGGSFTCYAGLQDGSNLGFAILGDIFIKSNMVVFDNSASPRIGLAVPANLP